MLNLNPSGFETGDSFDLLARPIQKWIYKQGWPGLREIQNKSIPVILNGGDVIISAATASGKTEAAFLPLISRALSVDDSEGFRIVYISPLKSLINDQHRRLETLCADCQLPLYKWHGDVAQGHKQRARQVPNGILLITPESLEATLMNRGGEATRLFGRLEAFVIDELHAFIGTERGLQLLSIMSRIEKAIGRHVDRVGLSATIGDPALAEKALRRGNARSIKTIRDDPADASALAKISIHTYEATGEYADDDDDDDDENSKPVDQAIASDLFDEFFDSPNLIFADSRARVEEISDNLRRICEQRGHPNCFLPHHGKLSKELREFAEQEIRDKRRAITIVATSTLEMGVDIGSVEAVAQVGPSRSVAGMRQRIGRSGRREGQRPTLRQIICEKQIGADAPLCRQLRTGFVHALATTELLLKNWCEPPSTNGFHFSTLAHQIIAIITQYGGRSPISLYQDLCIEGPFTKVTPDNFRDLLKRMADDKRQLIEQMQDGTILLGANGEKRIEHFTIYAVFETPEEFRIVYGEQPLGTIVPDLNEFVVGYSLLFAGRRWDIIEISREAKLIRVAPSKKGKTQPGGFGGHIHE